MRYLLITICFILPSFAFSQRNAKARADKEKNKYYDQIFGEHEKQFDVFKAPDKWKDEPLVMLCQKTHISFLRNTTTGYNQTKGILRRRFLIQDKSELETFSEFYFQTSDAIGIKHIKPDGEERKIETNDAIKVESNIPDFYSDSYHSAEYNKIAIPDLEVGDIIDYFKVFQQGYPGAIQVIASIDYDFPVVSQELILDVDKLWTFYYDSFNDAPKFKADPEGGIDNNGRRRKSVKRFVLKDSDRDARKKENWSYRYLNSPTVKFMAVTSYSPYADKRESTKKGMDIYDIINKNVYVESAFINTIGSESSKLAKECGVKDLPKKKKIEFLYRVLRHYCISNYLLETEMQKASYQAGAIAELSYDYFSLRPQIFMNVFANMLDKHDIEAEFVAVVPKYFGSLDDVVTPDEVTYGVYIPSTKQYYWPIDNFNLAGDENEDLQGANGFRIPRSKRMSESAFKKIEIPYSTADKNSYGTVKKITLNADNSLNVKETLSLTGLFKSKYNQLFLYHSDYAEEDVKDFEYRSLSDRIPDFKRNGYKSKDLKWKDKRIRSYTERYTDLEKTQRESLTSWIKSEYQTDTLTNYQVEEYGVLQSDPTLKITFDFSSDKYVKKAGPNLIFELGALIGDQLELKEKQMTSRTKDIQFNFSKTITSQIEVALPDGLTAHGLEALNVNVDNSHGSFTGTASQTGNKVIVETKKTYKKAYAPAAEWPNYVEMLEAAYDFTQQKVILKK